MIGLAASLDDPLNHRAIGNLSIILQELEPINATRTQQLRGSRALRRYISQDRDANRHLLINRLERDFTVARIRIAR